MNWEKIGETARNYSIEPSAQAWQKVEERLHSEPHPQKKQRPFFRAAAAILILAVAGTLYWNNVKERERAQAFTLELVNPEDVDQVALMALDFRKYLEIHHPTLAHPSKR